MANERGGTRINPGWQNCKCDAQECVCLLLTEKARCPFCSANQHIAADGSHFTVKKGTRQSVPCPANCQDHPHNVRRQHPLSWADCSRAGCTHSLADALGIDPVRGAETDAIVNALAENHASLRDIVTALSEREMTDAEFATALYALGWFDRWMRG